MRVTEESDGQSGGVRAITKSGGLSVSAKNGLLYLGTDTLDCISTYSPSESYEYIGDSLEHV